MVSQSQNTASESLGIEPLLTAQDLAKLMVVSQTTVYELVSAGQLPCIRIGARGGRYRFARADVDAYLSKQRVGATSGDPMTLKAGERLLSGSRPATTSGGLSLLRQAGYKG
jgi:excisionase family DNA binding protein